VVVRVPEVELKASAEESTRAPPADANGMRPEVSEEIAKLVVVAWVPVAFTNVKFWRVVEPVAARLANVRVPVAVMFPAVRLPETRALPCTASLCEGVVVPIPTVPSFRTTKSELAAESSTKSPFAVDAVLVPCT
jgi:hypothetical protein